jgi:DNA-binding response OmpR family regulator
MDVERRRAVIVEDDFLLASALEDLLRHMGYDIAACEGNFDKAMQVVQRADYDFAVVDLRGKLAYPILE